MVFQRYFVHLQSYIALNTRILLWKNSLIFMKNLVFSLFNCQIKCENLRNPNLWQSLRRFTNYSSINYSTNSYLVNVCHLFLHTHFRSPRALRGSRDFRQFFDSGRVSPCGARTWVSSPALRHGTHGAAREDAVAFRCFWVVVFFSLNKKIKTWKLWKQRNVSPLY